MKTEKIIRFCEDFLQVKNFKDYAHNGLQIGGKPHVKKIALGVSASLGFLSQASEWGADLCLVHHGIIFGKIDCIDDVLRGRLELLLKNNMALAGFHLPLDAHPEVGNNIVLCKKLGLENLVSADIGFTGDLKTPLSFEDFASLLESVTDQPVVFLENFGSEKVSRVCIISGGASGYSKYALETGADSFVFGELKESAFHEMKERGLNFFAAGHFATERFGIKALGARIEQEFPDIETKFFDEDCFV